MQDASSLGQAANLTKHCSRPGSRDAYKLAHIEDSQTAQGEKAEERTQRTACSIVRLASAQVGWKRALRKPLIDPGKRVRKACLQLLQRPCAPVQIPNSTPLRKETAVTPPKVCNFADLADSWPILVMVERGIGWAA